MKQCGKCKITKELSEFNKRDMSKDGFQNYCRGCQKEYMGGGEYMLQRDYGISLEDKRQMIADQGGLCFTCRKPFTSTTKTHVDHCHDSKKIRGILCHNCNTTLGLVYESTQTLQNLKEYLEHHAQENTAPPVPAGDYQQGEVYPELGSFSAAGTWQDDDNPDHHCGADARQDFNYRAQESSRDSMGRGGEEVGTFKPPQGEQDHWYLHPAYGWIER